MAVADALARGTRQVVALNEMGTIMTIRSNAPEDENFPRSSAREPDAAEARA